MKGCLRRAGCAVLILAVLAVAWYWYAWVDRPATRPAPGRGIVWEPVTPDGAQRTRTALESLAQPRTNSVVVSAGDVASYIFFSMANRLPEASQNIEAAVIADRLAVRAVVPLKEIGASRVLGPLTAILSERDSIQFSGTLRVAQPELGEYRVRDLRVAQLRVPSGLIPRVLRQIDHGDRPPGIAPDALALPVPVVVREIRIADGLITLYKTAR
jgi:hypothetical protein